MTSEIDALLNFALPSLVLATLAIAACFTVAALAAPQERKLITGWYLLGFLAVVIKIWILQKTPQWTDVSLDSQLYKIHAEAFSLHWRGEAVNAQMFRLNGFLSGWESSLGYQWRPDMRIPYASVFGTYEWPYASFIGGWRVLTIDWEFWATYSNAAFAGAFPAASYGITKHLGGGNRVSSVAALITLFDPSIGVNAAWILKDTLAGLFAVVAIWAALTSFRSPTWVSTIILSLAITGLSLTRFAAFAAVFLSLVLFFSLFFKHVTSRTTFCVVLAMIGSVIAFGAFYSVPKIPSPSVLIGAAATPISAQKDTFVAADSADAYDPTVGAWHDQFTKNPLHALIVSAARSLFAPYPWIAVQQGISGSNGIELYYLGMPVWIICLPGILWGVFICIQRPRGEGFFVACILFALLCAYTLFLGEWSTRQRVFMLPVFFCFAALGWDDLRSRYVRSAFKRRKIKLD